MVKEDKKKRYELKEKDGQLLIKASQGHTVVINNSSLIKINIEKAKEYKYIVHGTKKNVLEKISKEVSKF